MFQRIVNKLNDMRPRHLFMLAIFAGGLMFITIVLGMQLLTKPEVVVKQEQPQPVVEKTAVVVAKTNIQPRTRIQDTMLQMKEFPVDMVPEGAIKNFDEIRDVQVKVSIFAGDILTIQKVFAEASDEGFTGSIPPDCRAVSINVNDVTGVAGFAKPGDRVDLLLVEKGKHSVTTNLLLQNVPLLSINQDTGHSAPVGENGVPTAPISNPSIATFALRPEDAIKLIAASKLGEIYLTLRPSKPQAAYIEPMEYTIDSVDAPHPARETVPAIPSVSMPQVPFTPPVPKIEIIAGDQIVQSSTPTPTPAPRAQGGPTTSQQPLPVIPSNGYTPTTPPAQQGTPTQTPTPVPPVGN